MKYNYFFLESLIFLIIVSCLVLCSCKSLPPIKDSEYERYLRERQQEERDRQFDPRFDMPRHREPFPK